MSLYASGGPYVSQKINVASGKEISDFIAANAPTCGWTVLSNSGAGDIVVKSAVTPGGNYIVNRFRGLATAGGNNYATFRNAAGDKVGGERYMTQTGRDLQIIIQPFAIYTFALGQTAGDYCWMSGTLIRPSFMPNAAWPGEYGWAVGGHAASGVGWRTTLNTGTNGAGGCDGIANGTLMDNSGTGSNQSGFTSIMIPRGPDGFDAGLWGDGITLDSVDPIVAWGDTQSSPKRRRGQLPDATVLSSNPYASDAVRTFMGHTWFPITVQSGDPCGLWVIVG